MVNYNLLDDVIDLYDVPKEEWKNYFGNGYRSVVYEINPEHHCGEIVFFGYDKEDNPKIFRMPWESHIWYRVMFDTGIKDMYGHFIKEKTFSTASERRKYVDGMTSLHIVECLKPESEFLHWAFDDVVLDPDFNKQNRRTFFLDIETEISDHFVGGNDASNRINMITVFDTMTDKFYTWSLSKVEKHLDEENYILFDDFKNNENSLLMNFINWWQKNFPDVVCGWNSKAFDIPYIFRRIENVLGEDYAKKLSPVGKYRIREVDHDNPRAQREANIEVDISGVYSVDELVFYRDKFTVTFNLDGGYNLSNVGEHEGLGRKVEYEGTLKDLYEKDWQKFYEYNVRDVALLRDIEKKCKLIPLSIKVAGSGLVNYDAIYGSINYLIGALVAYTKAKFNLVFQSYANEKNDFYSFEGAFVFPVNQGLYKGGIATIDFNSLYPSNIRSVNLSPETYVGKIGISGVSNNDDPIDLNEQVQDEYYFKSAESGKIRVIKREELLKLIDEKCIYTRNNTLFLKHSVKQGIISAWCKDFYGMRKANKNEEQRLDLAIYKGEIPEDKIEETKVKIQNYHDTQIAIKIMINSIYGILGTSHSPIGNPELAQTITRQGRFANISASKYIKNCFKQMFKIDDDYINTISGDTDSQFINIQCVTEHMRKKHNLPKQISKWSDEMKLKLWEFMDNFVEKKVNLFVQNLMKDYCHTEHPEVLRYSLEYIAGSGVYESKKHYYVQKVVSEGPELTDKIKTTGISLKQTILPVEIKSFLKDVYFGTVCDNWTEQDFRKYINEMYDKFLKLDINQISLWKGWSTDKQSTGFLKMAKGAGAIATACHSYNQILEKLKIGKKYDEIKVGDYVRFCYINPNNPYGIQYIAFHDGQWPKEFNNLFSIDYKTMFEKLIMKPLERFLEATRFQNVDPRQRELCSLDDL